VRPSWLIASCATIAVLVVPCSVYASDPSIGLRPGHDTPTYARAAADAGADGVHLSLYWEEIEKERGNLRWGLTDQKLRSFTDAGLDVSTVRVVDAPDWAVAGNRCRFSSCPPAREHYDEFQAFVRAAVTRYGPGTWADVRRVILWNEPNLSGHWGGRTHREGSHRAYSNLLVRFYRGARAASPTVEVNAGELAAGDNQPIDWARKFTAYSTRRDRNSHYDVLTIHAYSATPNVVIDKIRRYGRLRGVTNVSIGEIGWSAGRPNPDTIGRAGYKCTSETGQRRRLRETVTRIRRDTRGVEWLAWLQAIDKRRDKEVKCLDDSGYYAPRVRDEIGPYGLYKRAPDGSLRRITPRPVRDTFRALAG
jgi:hypothetical protein